MNSPSTFLHLDALGWTAAQAIIAALALLGLIYYCLETYRLRGLAQEQMEAGFRPVIAITEEFPKLEFRNVGTGPALNVRYLFATDIGRATKRETTAVAIGEGAGLGDLAYFVIRDVEISYESVSGRHYVTKGSFLKDDQGTASSLVLQISVTKNGSRSNTRA